MSDIDINPLTGDYDLKGRPDNGAIQSVQPFISNALPSKVKTNSNETVYIYGFNFDQNTTFDLGPNITVAGVTIVDPNNAVLSVTTNSVVATNNEVKAFNGTSQNFNNLHIFIIFFVSFLNLSSTSNYNLSATPLTEHFCFLSDLSG